MTAGQPEAGSGASRPRRRPLRRWVLIGALALAAVIAGSVALAMAGDQDRGDLLPPSIATDGRGLSTVAWTEIGRPGLRVAQEPAPGTWSLPRLVDEDGGPGTVAVGRDRLAHVAYTAPGGLFVADQLPGSQGSPAFRSRLVTPDAVGRPSIAVAPSGTTAVIYQTGDSRLRVARRKASGRWRVGPAGIAGSQPLLARSGARRFAAAAKSDQQVLLAQGGASAPFRSAGEVRSPSPMLGFDLTTAGEDRGRRLRRGTASVGDRRPARPPERPAGRRGDLGHRQLHRGCGGEPGAHGGDVPRAHVRVRLARRPAGKVAIGDARALEGPERGPCRRPRRQGGRGRLLGSGRPAGCGARVLPEPRAALPAAADHHLSAATRSPR